MIFSYFYKLLYGFVVIIERYASVLHKVNSDINIDNNIILIYHFIVVSYYRNVL